MDQGIPLQVRFHPLQRWGKASPFVFQPTSDFRWLFVIYSSGSYSHLGSYYRWCWQIGARHARADAQRACCAYRGGPREENNNLWQVLRERRREGLGNWHESRRLRQQLRSLPTRMERQTLYTLLHVVHRDVSGSLVPEIHATPRSANPSKDSHCGKL